MHECRSCKSKDVYVTDYHTLLCLQCGLESQTAFEMNPIHVSYNCCHHQPFAVGYNRQKRFRTMLINVVFGTCNSADENMLKYLAQFQNYVDESSLLKQMKKSNLRDKRYTSLHLFSRLFLPSYKKPVIPCNWDVVEKSIMRMFSEIELVHRKMFSKPFFSYVWLLQKIIIYHGLCMYSKYIKKLKCPNRVKAYDNDFTQIMTTLCQKDRFVGDRVCVSVFPRQHAVQMGDHCLPPSQKHYL